jgi:hypothetical protein
MTTASVSPLLHDVQRQINKALKDVETIQSFLHPLNDRDPRTNLFQARGRREDAVRMTVLQMSLAIEDLMDGLFWRVFAGHPTSKRRKSKTKGIPRELDELLTSGRMGFEAKIKLARILRIITKAQHNKLDKLRALRNKCAHHWMLDIVRKRGNRARPSRRLLEHDGRNLFDLEVLERFVRAYSAIYLKLFEKYLS